MKKMKMMVLVMAAAAVVSGVPGVTCQAAMGNYNFVSIASGSVDSITVNGVTVEALYRPYDRSCDTDTTYSCAAFVSRFYRDVYGVQVSNLNSIWSTPKVSQGSFVTTDTPKVGDVIRDNNNVHWAIVKEVNGNTVTVIQQNAWNGAYNQAWVGATIQVGDSDYTFFQWSGNAGAADNGQSSKTGNYSFDYQKASITDTNATVSAKVNNPNRVSVQTVGCRLWDKKGNLLKNHTESCTRPESRFNMWYDIQAELGITLEAGTTYKYQFYLLDGGNEYTGDVQQFTTTGVKKTSGKKLKKQSVSH